MINLGRELAFLNAVKRDKHIERDTDSKINEISRYVSESKFKLGMATYLKK